MPNHTSDEHEWFQKALAAGPGSPERERYIFRPGKGRGRKQPPNNWNSVFGGIAWEQVDDGPDGSTQWYLHIFDRTQPDLNWRNPEVRTMFVDVLRFWLDRGVDGFRVDVAHGLFKDARLRDEKNPEPDSRHLGFLLEHETKDEPMWDQPEVHEVYRDWRRVLDEYDGDRMAVAEAWTQTPERTAAYVRPDELQQAFNFAWLLARWDAADMADCIRRTFATLDPVGANPTWVLSNHDVMRHATRYGGGPGRRRPRPRGHAGDARAARVVVPLPGRGARPRERRRPRGAAAGPRLVPHRRRVARPLPRADAVGRHHGRRSGSAAASSRGCRCPSPGRTSPSRRRPASAGRRSRCTARR